MQAPKLIYIAQRHPALSASAFTARWRKHAALGMSQPRWKNVARYLHCDQLATVPPLLAGVDWDGVAIVVFRSEAARQNHIAEEASRRIMRADELDTFAQPVAKTSLLTYPEVIKPGPVGDYKLFVFWQSSDPGFSASWRASGQGWRGQLSNLKDTSLVQNWPVQPLAERMDGLCCDGIDELTANDVGTLQLLARDWIIRSQLHAVGQMLLTRAVVLHEQP